VAAQRAYERFPIRLDVTVVHAGAEHATVSRNVSLGGMFLETADSSALPFGGVVTLRFRIPTLKEDTSTEATIRWKQPDGIGVQFASLRALEVWGFNQLFKQSG
jgi:hypothetical protein